MGRRIGVRLLGTLPPGGAVFGPDLGEDWVVPREGFAFLVAREVQGGGVLSAYGPDGHLSGERFAPSLAALVSVLEDLHRRGCATPPQEIPGAEASALRFLRRAAAP